MQSLRQIRSFMAVYEEGSFTRAAEREGTTQSGASQHVKQLEAELGVRLFERHGRDVAPTAAGRLYYRDCADIIKRLEAARQTVTAQELAGTIRVGLMPTFTRSVLSLALKRFLAAAPRCDIKVVEAYSGLLTELTLKGDLDFAVVPAFEGTVGIAHHFLARDREMLVRARVSGSSELTPVKLAELGALKIVLPGPQNTRRSTIETYFSTYGVAIAQRLELDAMMGTLQFVASSDWVAILPFVMMASDLDDRRFEIRPIDDPPFYSEFVLIEPARRAMSPAAALFAEILKAETEQVQAILRHRMAASGVHGAPPRGAGKTSRRSPAGIK